MTGILNLLAGAVSSAIKDTYFNLTTLLLPGDGTNGAQNNTFLDSSTNNFSITRNGNTTQGTFSPFSQTGWSNYFDGTGDFLNFVSSASFGYGTGDYTIEGWVWSTTRSVANTFFANGTDNCNLYIKSSTGIIGLYTGSANDSATALPLNQWNHIAVVRNGSGSNNTQVYLNGTSILTITNTTNFSNTTFFIGRNGASGSEYMNGYISNVRVTKGRAVYTSSFTPPASPLGKTSGGQNPPQGTECTLLTCQSNRFVDNSDAALTVTPNADSSVQAFSPFAPSGAYTTTAVGGSGYFDGTGDYLSFASNAAFTVGTGDLTIEAWIYVTSLSQAYQGIISGRVQTSPNFPGLGLTIDNSQLLFTILNIGTGLRDTANVPLNQWVHVVGVRSGTNAALFVNGSRKASSTNSENGTSSDMVIGRYYPGTNDYYFSGYIAGARLLKGTAAYDPTQTSITIPTAPSTNVTNTSFLTNFTNAGITDATAKNDLETVGNAQISTTQSKFGGSSMYFDGTGDGLILPASPFYNFLDGNFTVEAWVYIAGNSPLDGLSRRIANVFSVSTSSAFSFNFVIRGDGTTTGTGLEIYNGTNIVNVTGTISQSTWHHIAVTKSGTSVYFFLNGTQMGTTQTTSGNWGSATVAAQVGRSAVTSYTFDLNGYIDDLRITRFARYTTNFTAPTAAFALQ